MLLKIKQLFQRGLRLSAFKLIREILLPPLGLPSMKVAAYERIAYYDDYYK